MAGYKAHLAMGMGVGLGGGLWLILSFSLSLFYLPVILLATVIGSLMPDLDSESGRPVRLLFVALGFVFSFFIGYYLLFIVEAEILQVALAVIAVFIIINFGFRHLFMKYTHHRGIFHSLVAVLTIVLSFNCTFLSLEIPLFESIIMSSALGVGYLSHLILDEMNSFINLSGIPFVPKKSLGTALKISTKSLPMNTLIILLLTILIYVNVKLIIQ